jgi:hypothetical protein
LADNNYNSLAVVNKKLEFLEQRDMMSRLCGNKTAEIKINKIKEDYRKYSKCQGEEQRVKVDAMKAEFKFMRNERV